MTVEKLFTEELRRAKKMGLDHTKIVYLAGCTERKLVLTEAEIQAAKGSYQRMWSERLWQDVDFKGGWLFGSPETMLNIGLVPGGLARQRLGLNWHYWDIYHQAI